MTDTDKEAKSDPVEVMARAIFEAETSCAAGEHKDEDFHFVARSALQAAEAAGWVMVPRVPTEAMIEAGVSCERGPATGIGGRYTIGDGVRDEYAAMIEAASAHGEG